jgi:hypothetical protein
MTRAPHNAGVSVHIERLIIDGVPMQHRQARILQSALLHELTRLLETSSSGLDRQGGAVPERAAPAISLRATAQPAELGRQIARSLVDSLTVPK